MAPKIRASVEAIRAISHQFAQCQTAIRWLEWLQCKLSILSEIWPFSAQICLARDAREVPGQAEKSQDDEIRATVAVHQLLIH
jgi:hypothetical protein